jgi:hypothetical protein
MMSFLTSSTAVEVYSGSTAVGWTAITGGGGGGVSVGTAAPSTPAEGDLWWDSDDGKLYVYYDDGTSQQWVDAAGPSVAVQSTAPTGYEGQLWLDDTDGSMYVYYTDPGGGSSSWIGAVSRSGGILQVVQTSKTDTFSTTSTTPVDITGLSATITPRSTSSKILVICSFSTNRTSVATSAFQLLRGSTNIGGGDVASSRLSAISAFTNHASNYFGQVAFEFLDSPSTTSSTTYKVQGFTEAGTLYLGRSNSDTDNTSSANVRTSARITLIEVAG